MADRENAADTSPGRHFGSRSRPGACLAGGISPGRVCDQAVTNGNSLACEKIDNNHVLMNPARLTSGKNVLWLWLLPVALSWCLLSWLPPWGRGSFWVEAFLVLICCLVCGFGLALSSYSTPGRRFWGGLILAVSSLGMVFSIAFLGCLPIPAPRMSPAQVEAQRTQQEANMKAYAARRIAPRDAFADATMLDLSPYFDAVLDLQSTEKFRGIGPGTHVWNGVKYDVRGKIQLMWQGKQGVAGIPVGRKCSALYFLHGVEWASPSSIVSQFVIHYGGTNIATIPIVYGRDVASEYLGMKSEPAVTLTNLVVWRELISTNGESRPFRGFHISHWDNPFPDQPVDTIDFVPGQNNRSAFLVAITLEPVEDEKP
jgi:hypothetical protein